MIKKTPNLIDAKNYVLKLKNKEVEVLVNLGRNKNAKYCGMLSGVYPALFTITPTCKYVGKTSFSYSELLCGAVKLRLKK